MITYLVENGLPLLLLFLLIQNATSPPDLELQLSKHPSTMAYLQHKTLYPQMSAKGPFTVEVPGCEKVEGETIPRRNPVSKDKLVTSPSDDVKTIFDIIKKSANKFGNAKALGSRKVIKTHTETKMVKKMVDGEAREVEKKWTYFELGEYNYLSFVEYEKMVLEIGAGLRKIGMEKGDRLHIFAATR